MGRKQHQSDKLWLTTQEMKYFFGGYKGDRKIDPEEVLVFFLSTKIFDVFIACRLTTKGCPLTTALSASNLLRTPIVTTRAMFLTLFTLCPSSRGTRWTHAQASPWMQRTWSNWSSSRPQLESTTVPSCTNSSTIQLILQSSEPQVSKLHLSCYKL